MPDNLESQLANVFSTAFRSQDKGMRESLLASLFSGEEKMTKAEADYRSPNEGDTNERSDPGPADTNAATDSTPGCCGDCTHYAGYSCKIVAGHIDPGDTCDYYHAGYQAGAENDGVLADGS